ncbi:MAG TPA: hypothetical protein VH040_11075 [Usitatibacter sp.]|jgi:hypothetical protein|nr:hypothetical protein [Usitatibacter sp.]
MSEITRSEIVDRIAKRRAEEEGLDASTDERPTTTRRLNPGADDRDCDILERANRLLAETSDSRSRAGAPSRSVAAKLDEYSEHLYDGHPQVAATAMAEALTEHTATVKADLKRELKLEQGMDDFARRFPLIVRDPHLAELADRHLDAALAAGQDEDSALRHAGESTLAEAREMARAAGFVDRPARTGGGRSPAAGSDEQTDEVHGVIAEMAAARPHAAAQRSRGDS